MSQSAGEITQKINRLFSELISFQGQIAAAKKGLRNILKESEDVDLKNHLKELTSARKKLSEEIRDFKEQIERQAMENNPEIKDFREQVLELEEKEADKKVEARELATPLLKDKKIIELDILVDNVPTKVQLMGSVVASVNGREQHL